MKNYYEILEVNEQASQDIIQKVYKILAKKYHPDTTTEKFSEEKFKEIAEAYETLSDGEKRRKYDEQLQAFKNSERTDVISLDEFQQLQNYCNQLENQLSVYQKKGNYFEQIQNKAYQDAYVNTVKEFGYNIRYKPTLKESFKNFMAWVVSIAIISLIAYVVWHVPALKEKVTSLFGIM